MSILVPRVGGHGRAAAVEVMIPNAAIRNLIREDKLHQVYSQMQIGQGKTGMQTMNQSLADLYLKKVIPLEEANNYSSDPEELQQIISAGGEQPLGLISVHTKEVGNEHNGV